MFPKKIFVTGIGTNVGKSYATGWLAKQLCESGVSVITQKLIQTGNQDMSEDIDIHRKVMNIPLQAVDLNHLTAPIILSYPASPHLSAKIDKVDIDFSIATKAADSLLNDYEAVLIEGAGGIMVPLKDDYLTIDYIVDESLPVVVVTNGQLGSINHTLLTLEILKSRGVRIYAVIYNPYFDEDKIICEDTINYLENYIHKNYCATKFMLMSDALID